MTIDERLEKLVERHEALTQTVELMAIERREMAQERREMAEEQRELAKNNQTLNLLVREITGGIRDLVAVVRSREQRLSHLEGQL